MCLKAMAEKDADQASNRAGKSIEPLKPSTFLLQFAALSEWAMLDLNQRPPPCKGEEGVFPGVARCSRTGLFKGVSLLAIATRCGVLRRR